MMKLITTLRKYKFFSFKFKANGCSFVPDFIFKDVCDLHDEDYYYLVPKHTADLMFYTRMLNKCKRIKDKTERAFYEDVAYAFYIGVKYFGWYAYFRCMLNDKIENLKIKKLYKTEKLKSKKVKK